MNFSVVFNSTGDSLPFKTINTQTADVLCYYVDYLNSKNLNKFSSDIASKIKESIEKLHSTITECNGFIYELLDGYIDTCELEGYISQKMLSKLHVDWVRSQTTEYNILEKRKKYNNSEQSELIHSMFPDEIPTPSVGVIIDKLGVKDSYNRINKEVHAVEELFHKFKFQVSDQPWVELTNPFSKALLTNNNSNFSLPFNHLGRTLYNKFINYDHALEFDDENTFNELLGFVELNLMPPQTIPLSKEYVEWCTLNNKIPSGDNLNIGNIPNLEENLTGYRTIIFKNSLQNNSFSIQLNKG
jgi:hypothetical protein